MLKFFKNNKWWVIILSVFALFFSSFGIFSKSYVESNKQKVVHKVENYIKASSYAVESRILKETENLNEDYLNQKIGKKPILDEFDNNFVWRPNNSKTTTTDTISDLWKTYFGLSSDILNDNLQIQYKDNKDNNKLKDIEHSKGEITPQNINFLLTISKSLERFLNGFAPSLASLGLSFLQNTILHDRDDPNFIKYKNGLNSFADVIENNKNILSFLAKVLTPADLEKDYYKDLTVNQALTKNINQIAAVISNNQEFKNETDADKIPEALDKLLAELGLDSISQVIAELGDFENQTQNIKQIFTKIQNVFNPKNIEKIKQKAVELLKKATPYLTTYIYSEIFFGLYYTIHTEIKNPSELLKLKADNNKFLALTQNKLDLNILFNGIAKVLKDKNSFKRFYEFIFKRFDENKIFNPDNVVSKNGVGNLIIDIVNWLESKLSTIINSLGTLIKFAELSINDQYIRETLEYKIIDTIKTKLNETGQPLGKWNVNFENGTAIITSGGFWAMITIKAKFFGNDGLIPKLLTIIKKIKESLENSQQNIISQLKNIFLLKDINDLDLSIASKSLSDLVKMFKDFLGDQTIINLIITGPFYGKVFGLNSIYDLLELPYEGSFLTNAIRFFAKSKIDPTLNKIKKVSQTLQKYKFISKEEDVKTEFSSYLEKLINHLKLYEKPRKIKVNLLDSLYSGDVTTDIAEKWIDFVLQDSKNKDNPFLPLIRIATKNEKLESLDEIKNKWMLKIKNVSQKIEKFKNISKIRDIKITIPELLLKHFGLEKMNNQTITQLLETLGKYLSEYSSKNPDKIVAINISSLGKILSALTIRVSVRYKKEQSDLNFLFDYDPKKDQTKTVLKALAYGFDTHDNSSDTGANAIKYRPRESYYNWDKIELYINGSNKPVSLYRSKLKDDLSYSPLHMLLGINPDKSSYLKDSIGYVIGTLFGGLTSNDPNYNLSIENKKDAVGILNVFNYFLDKKDIELKKREEQIAEQYYNKNAWSTKELNSNDNEINYELIRLKVSNTNRSKQLGNRFEVRLLKNKNNPYWKINRIIALNYKAA
ncbi:STREFT protein [Mycoplasma feriruminatoris]|uniref:STREFT protein n=1 Tax=Mycoplasma feriruminatoris TaxID=1179777 RepID=UPI00241E055E|nr:STREFT protein [Mycoplasma feriruminatoris]WFQ95628.1 STREFT protein [Mycoplasma feriruminatoris]